MCQEVIEQLSRDKWHITRQKKNPWRARPLQRRQHSAKRPTAAHGVAPNHHDTSTALLRRGFDNAEHRTLAEAKP